MKRLVIGLPVAAAMVLVVGLHWHALGQGGGFGGGSMMGGMGGGEGMGMGGGMPGTSGANDSRWPQRDKILNELAISPVQWQRPNGDPPKWLQNGKIAHEAQEQLRDRLNLDVKSTDFLDQPLVEVLKYLSSEHNIDFEINQQGLSDEGIARDVPVTLSAYKGTLREILRRILEVHHLTYVVHENYVEITSRQSANERPVLRCYDLSFVQSDSRNVSSLVEAIETTIEPMTWQANGGNGSIFMIGSLLVVSTTEWAHFDIEKLLYRLSAPSNAAIPVANKINRN